MLFGCFCLVLFIGGVISIMLLLGADFFVFVGSILWVVFFFLLVVLFNVGFVSFENESFKLVGALFVFFLGSNLLSLTCCFLSFNLFPVLLVSVSFTFWLSSLISLMKSSSLSFLSHFSQGGLSLVMCCCMVFIEVISIVIRSLTLAFRLMANLLGGHLMMELAGENTSSSLLMMALTSYEVFVSIVQAIIFSLLVFFYHQESLEKL